MRDRIRIIISTITTAALRVAMALLISVVLFGCTSSIGQIVPFWTTLDSNFGDSIIDEKLERHGMTDSNVIRSSSAFEKFTLMALGKAGHLRTSDALLDYLQSSKMACALEPPSKHTCRMSRYKVSHLDSGGTKDGTSRIDWEIFILWDGDPSPVQPSIYFTRTTQRVPDQK